MDPMMIKQARGLEYIGPRKALLTSMVHQLMSQQPHLPRRVQNWRTNNQQPGLHRRQAALFCFGRKCMESIDRWALAPWPDQNSPVDFVFRQTKFNGDVRYEFVQLKELVPDEIDAKQSLQDLLDDLAKKYPSAGGLTVAIHLHRDTTTKISDLRKPNLVGGSLWLFGLGGEPPHNAFIFGDWLKTPVIAYFTYPRFHPGESLTHWKDSLEDEG